MPAPPPAPPSYGHPLFHTPLQPKDVFYRREPWPTSRRIDLVKQTVAHQTYGSPASQLRFITTGFGAVARNALPSPFPACFRYQLRPDHTTGTLRCGAIVPQSGQAGGGVDVRLDSAQPPSAPMRHPTAAPTVIAPF